MMEGRGGTQGNPEEIGARTAHIKKTGISEERHINTGASEISDSQKKILGGDTLWDRSGAVGPEKETTLSQRDAITVYSAKEHDTAENEAQRGEQTIFSADNKKDNGESTDKRTTRKPTLADKYAGDIIAMRAQDTEIKDIAEALPEAISTRSVKRIIAKLRAQGVDVPTTPGRAYSKIGHEKLGEEKMATWHIRTPEELSQDAKLAAKLEAEGKTDEQVAKEVYESRARIRHEIRSQLKKEQLPDTKNESSE